MDQGGYAVIKLLASGAMGYAYQWVLFGPKKVPDWAAWGILAGTAVALYTWMTPTIVADFSSDWRLALVPLINFFLAAKGTMSIAKSANVAPQTNAL